MPEKRRPKKGSGGEQKKMLKEREGNRKKYGSIKILTSASLISLAQKWDLNSTDSTGRKEGNGSDLPASHEASEKGPLSHPVNLTIN